MGPACKAVCFLVLGLYIPFQLVDTFYFNRGDDDEQNTKEFFGPFVNLDGPIRIEKAKEREDEMKRSHGSYMDSFPSPSPNITQEPDLRLLRQSGLGCNTVREERYRCCRVFDQVVEAWWCPEIRPFCCHQGTSCAVCCTPDELRIAEGRPPPVSCQQRAPSGRRGQEQDGTAVDDNWFWTGMKAAWLTMFAILMASICCTCLAYKCIKFLVTFVNEEDSSDLEEEYLAFHFDNLGLTSAEDRTASQRGQAAARGLLPPKYSDINFTPVQPDVPVAAPVPGEPPPQYTSEPEPGPEPEPEQGPEPELGTGSETEARTEARPQPRTETVAVTETETVRPPSAPPPDRQI